VTSDKLPSRLKVRSVFEVAGHNRLRWFGHVERKSDDDWVKKCQQLVVEGKTGRGRGVKSWLQCVRSYMKELGLTVDDVKGTQVWKGTIFDETSDSCKHGK